MEERPKSIPEIRGFGYTPVPRLDIEGNIDDKHYSARSYAAMYGITIEEAEHVRASCNTHTQADRMITSTLAADPERLKEVIGQGDNITMDDLTEEEKRFLKRGAKPEMRSL